MCLSTSPASFTETKTSAWICSSLSSAGFNGYRSLSVYHPMATFRKKKAAVKVHTLLNVQGSIPTFIFVTPGSVHDVSMMDIVPFEAESVYTMDRAYLDFTRLYQINQLSAFFVIKSKSNTRLRRGLSDPFRLVRY